MRKIDCHLTEFELIDIIKHGDVVDSTGGSHLSLQVVFDDDT